RLDGLPGELHEPSDPGGLRVATRDREHMRIVVAAEERGTQRAQPDIRTCTCLAEKVAPCRRVMTAPARETEMFAMKSGRDVGRHPGRLDRQRSGAAERIDERAAIRVDLRPASAKQHRARKVFLQRRLALPFAPAAA